MNKMLTAAALAGALVTANAAVLNFTWDIPSTSGQYTFELNTDTAMLSWSTANLWVDRSAAGDNIKIVPVPGKEFEYVNTYFVWPDGTFNEWDVLAYNPVTGKFANPTAALNASPKAQAANVPRNVKISDEWVQDLMSNTVLFTLDPEMGVNDLTGPVVTVTVVPENEGMAIAFGFGLMGWVAYNRFRKDS